MPQLDFNTYFTQSFWLIVIFLLTYLVFSQSFIPKLAGIVKSRHNFQNTRNWSLQLLYFETNTVRTIHLNFLHQKKTIHSFLQKFQQFLSHLQLSIHTQSTQHYHTILHDLHSYKSDLLAESIYSSPDFNIDEDTDSFEYTLCSNSPSY